MTARALGSFEVTSWNETTYSELEGGGKLTRASVRQAFTGGMEGEGTVEWLMCYRADGTASWCGLQRVDGRVGERSGSLVLQVSGTFDGAEARGTWQVVPGSGTGQLQGLRGSGEMTAPHGSTASFSLEYDFE